MASSKTPGPLKVASAQALLLAEVSPGAIEQVELPQALGRIAAKALHANWPLPQWPLSKMDGYALGPAGPRVGHYTLRGESQAGTPSAIELGPGECLRVSTGAVVPAQSTCVVPQEDTTVAGDQVTLTAQGQEELALGRYIRPVGSDLQAQALVCAAGQKLDAGRLSLLAASGHHFLSLHRPARVGILSTGSELVPLGQTPGPGQIVATNAMVLRWQCTQAGAQVLQERCVADSRSATQAALAELAAHCDLVLSCGGISVGPHDHVLPSLEALGHRGLFRKVRLAPGRPTTAGVLDQTLIIALPGNPASSYVTFELFVRPILRKISGYPEQALFRPQRWVACPNAPSNQTDRDRYLRVRVQGGQATALASQQSGDLSSLCGHNALLEIPAGPHQGPYRALLLAEHDWEGPNSTP